MQKNYITECNRARPSNESDADGLCKKAVNNHAGQSRMQSRARTSNITYII